MFSTQWSAPFPLGPFGLGTAAIGNLYREIDDDTARHVVDSAWEQGVRYFDSAPHYGLGLAERRAGRFLSDRPRDSFLFSTKVGRLLQPNPAGAGSLDSEGFVVPAAWSRRWDFSAEGVRRSLDASLERTGFDRIDIAYLHDPEGHLDQALDEALPELVRLRSDGVITAIGVGSKDPTALTMLIETGELDLAMVAGRYTLLEQPALSDVFPAAEKHRTGVVAVGVFNSGILASTSPSASDHYEYGTVPTPILERARALAAVCESHGMTLPHAAVQYVQRHPLVVNVTLGVGKPGHVVSNARWAQDAVPDALWQELEQRGLIPAGSASA